MVFLKENFEKVHFEKNHQTVTQKLPSGLSDKKYGILSCIRAQLY